MHPPVTNDDTELRADRRATLVARVLPPEEWSRLKATPPFAAAGLPDDPDTWAVVVVERAGRIIGTCSLFTAMHWDAWWIDPAYPGLGRGAVLRQLLRGSFEIFRQQATDKVYTGAEDATPEVGEMLARFGFLPERGRLYMLRTRDVRQAFRQEGG